MVEIEQLLWFCGRSHLLITFPAQLSIKCLLDGELIRVCVWHFPSLITGHNMLPLGEKGVHYMNQWRGHWDSQVLPVSLLILKNVASMIAFIWPSLSGLYLLYRCTELTLGYKNLTNLILFYQFEFVPESHCWNIKLKTRLFFFFIWHFGGTRRHLEEALCWCMLVKFYIQHWYMWSTPSLCLCYFSSAGGFHCFIFHCLMRVHDINNI